MGNLFDLQDASGILAQVLAAKGDGNGAKEAFDLQEKICREKGFQLDLQRCIEQRKNLGI